MKDDRALFQNPNALYCDLSIGACQRPQTAAFLYATDTSNTIGSVGSYGSGGRATCTAAWAFYVLGSPTTSSISGHLANVL